MCIMHESVEEKAAYRKTFIYRCKQQLTNLGYQRL